MNNQSPSDERLLLDRFRRNGMVSASLALCDQSLSWLWGTALRACQGNPTAAEITCERALRCLISIPEKRLSPRLPLVSVLARAARTDRPKSHRRSPRIPAPESFHPQAVWLALAPTLDDALARLQPREEAAIIYRYIRGFDLQETARRLEIDLTQAKSLTLRSLARLHEKFLSQFPGLPLLAFASALRHSATPPPPHLAEKLCSKISRTEPSAAPVRQTPSTHKPRIAAFAGMTSFAALLAVPLAVSWMPSQPKTSPATSAPAQTTASPLPESLLGPEQTTEPEVRDAQPYVPPTDIAGAR